MKFDRSTKLLLLIIAVSLTALASRPYVHPAPVQAQSSGLFYVEPGVVMLRAPDGSQQVAGKVMIDMRNGNVWGFPHALGCTLSRVRNHEYTARFASVFARQVRLGGHEQVTVAAACFLAGFPNIVRHRP